MNDKNAVEYIHRVERQRERKYIALLERYGVAISFLGILGWAVALFVLVG